MKKKKKKEENGRTRCEIKAFTYMCGVIVAGTTWFDDLTKRSFGREEVITTAMFHANKKYIRIKYSFQSDNELCQLIP